MIIFAILINLIIVILEIYTLIHIKGKKNIFKYYTYLQNFIALIISLIFSLYVSLNMISNVEIPEFVKGLRYVATCGLLATTFIFVVFLGAGNKVSMTEDDFLKAFPPKRANMILHYICPILSLISFLVFERELQLENGIWTGLVAIPSCLYWIVYLILSSLKLWEEPYDISNSKEKTKILDVLIFLFIPLSFIFISFILWNIM